MSAARDHKAAYQRRLQLARERGFRSLRQQRAAPTAARSLSDLQALPEEARTRRTDALRAVRHARRDKTTIEQAAQDSGVPISAVRFWAGSALQPRKDGGTRPTRADRLLRLQPLVVVGQPDTQFVVVRGSRAAQKAAEAFDVQWRYVGGGASADDLRRLAGLRVGGSEVEADPDVLDEVARRGQFEPAELYRELFS